MRATIFGAGYVGLVQAAALSEAGHQILCVDRDEAKVARLNAGEIPIHEPGLTSLVRENLQAGRLAFTADARRGVDHATIQFIAVGTPSSEDGSADVGHVREVAETIARHMERDRIVVTKSTVPVGTCDDISTRIETILTERGRTDISAEIVSNPEFLKEGSAVADFMKPDRIVIGTASQGAERRLRELYAPFNRNHEKIMVMDARSAELTKYAANCMLATKISFMNEIASVADRVGADIEKVRRGIGADPRIGYHFIYPGVGYGGSCFPKDIRAMIRTAADLDLEPGLLEAVERRNRIQKRILFDKIERHFDGQLEGRTFALWGLAFKPGTDDMREAPSRELMEALWGAGARVRAFDPEAMAECRRLYGKRDDLTLVETREDALEGADALVIVTDWKSFFAPDFETIGERLSERVIFDGRNLYDPAVVASYGLAYHSIGRPNRAAAG